MDNPAISGLKPASLWAYFAALSQISRPSHHEQAVQQYVLDEAVRLGLSAMRDDVGNVRVRKPASAGHEKAPGVILQGHLDMVAQKTPQSTHDFLRDPIRLIREGDWLRADHTTLGADNGIGVAAALAVLADNTLEHGPLEALFTASEETGMLGANGLQADWLQGQWLLNLDSERLGEICIGCAGGVDGDVQFPLHWQTPESGSAFTLSLGALKGGHSGMDIDRQRGNAIVLLLQLLTDLAEKTPIALADIHGGELRNAIPREAQAVFVTCTNKEELRARLQAKTDEIRRGLPAEDRDFDWQLRAVDLPEGVWQTADQQRILSALRLLPDGVDRFSVEYPDVVETSANLAQIRTNRQALVAQLLLRSLDDARRDDLATRIAMLCQLAGGAAVFSGAYPGWQPEPENDRLREIIVQEGAQRLGRTPSLNVIHAGLECGLFKAHYPHWQMASFGPTIEMPHSPDERVNIASVEVFWQWLCRVLAAIAHEKRA